MADLANESGGAVKADISTDRQLGRSRGFGTVLFETEEEAQAAIEVGDKLEGLRVHKLRSTVGFALHRRAV